MSIGKNILRSIGAFGKMRIFDPFFVGAHLIRKSEILSAEHEILSAIRLIDRFSELGPLDNARKRAKYLLGVFCVSALVCVLAGGRYRDRDKHGERDREI